MSRWEDRIITEWRPVAVPSIVGPPVDRTGIPALVLVEPAGRTLVQWRAPLPAIVHAAPSRLLSTVNFMLPQSFFPRLVALAIGLMLLLVPPRRAGAELTAEQERFFESKIRPILATRCSECHGPDAQESGLRVDSLQGLLDGGQRGPAIVPGDAQRSLLIHAVQHSEADLQMPEGEKLSGEEIRALVQWVDQGAFWPGQRAERRRPTWDTGTEVTAEDRQFWAFQPPRRPVLPLVKNRPWCRTPIDYFVLAELEKQGIAPAPPASPRTLVRRVYLDLWGLPPTPEQIDAFVADPSPDAYARLIDRLLASPRYGERWGRHWLDVARYADSNGLDENWAFEHIYRYRDWVLTAFNRDMPYDRFVQYQLAGDLMTPAGDEPFEERVQRLAATGFLSVGPKMIADDDPIKKKMDIVDEQLSTIGQTFLGLTIGCARCHDHKFDPIPTRDYYALAGILKSTRTMEHLKVVAPVWIHELHPPGFAEQLAAFEKRRRELLDQRDAFWRQVAGPAYLAARSSENSEGNQQDDSGAPAASTSSTYELPEEKELAKWVPEEQRQRWEELQAAIAEHETTRPQPVRVMGPTEGDVGDIPISLRGNYLTPGPVVPRGFLQVLTPAGRAAA
ncbi:MAG: hypothetical protein KatS3mg111_3092 [Pirellulaceae bacterium]|nr:MAG: hypothetical protein KatS3mg111_3092 [Pirellulaceae bacterium]